VSENASYTLLASADWFPERFDSASANFSFVKAEFAMIAGQRFLDHRWDRAGLEQRSASASSLLSVLPRQKPKLNFIWHTGFCCSTLLAKALNHSANNLSLCEPQILVDAADAKRAGLFARRPAFSDIPKLIFHLLAPKRSPAPAVTVKPAPAANVLLRDAATQTAGAMLFLYSDCRSFLISTAKLGEEGRKYARRMFIALLGDGHILAQWPPRKLLSLSDLELAALVWHMQIAEFVRNWRLVQARARSLDCDAFLINPFETLSRLDEFLSLNIGSEKLAEVVAGPLFQQNAKDPNVSLGSGLRREQNEAIARQLGPDLDRIVSRSYEICPSTPRGAPLPNPLITIEKKYI
jgi:hypothetical protein